jgi:hypothetical protein
LIRASKNSAAKRNRRKGRGNITGSGVKPKPQLVL